MTLLFSNSGGNEMREEIESASGQTGHAEAVFAEFVASGRVGSDTAFGELCEAHPEIEEDLRRLLESWRQVAGVLHSVSIGGSHEDGNFETDFAERLGRGVQRFSRYKVEEEIARGGQGTINRVWEADLQRHLAMKRLLPELSELEGDQPSPRSSRSLIRFLEEAQVTGQLGHPGVPPVHELGVDGDGRPFFTMPLVRGQELTKIFEAVWEGRDDWTHARVLGVFLKICEAVGYAHSKGVLHRDLKPGNVMVGRFGETYVMDWGLAHVLGREYKAPGSAPREDLANPPVKTSLRGEDANEPTPLMTKAGDVMGTPAYMAPEQARGDRQALTERSDVYAIGAMLYQMLGRHAPYRDPGKPTRGFEVLTRLLDGPPEALSELAPTAPPELVAIAEKAMEREPSRRYPSASALANDIIAYLDHRPVSAHAPSLWHTVRLSIRRHRAVATAIGVAALVLLVTSTVFVVQLAAAAEEERTAKDLALAAKDESQRRYDIIEGSALLDAERRIYPMSEANAGRMERWIEQTHAFRRKAEQYSTQPALGSSLGKLDLNGIREMQEASEALAEPLARAEHFVAIAKALQEAPSTEVQDAWEAAIASIAESEPYDGLIIAPQRDLLPLGANPRSGLWEFWHMPSGERPEPHQSRQDEGAWAMTPDTGIVLVLLPKGSFLMGSPNEEANRKPNELQHQEHLEAFFLSKYELTQGQFARIMGTNPSVYQEARSDIYNPSHPVDNVDWFMSSEVARRYAMRLPSEVEWEYAVRAGTTTVFYWGDDEDGARGRENLRDSGNWNIGHPSTRAAWRDPYAMHAPVGEFTANPFGLHDMQGNQIEWCEDGVVDLNSESPPWILRDLEEGVGAPRTWTRVRRGISFYMRPGYARSAFRQHDVPSGSNQTYGVRLARNLEP